MSHDYDLQWICMANMLPGVIAIHARSWKDEAYSSTEGPVCVNYNGEQI